MEVVLRTRTPDGVEVILSALVYAKRRAWLSALATRAQRVETVLLGELALEFFLAV